MERRLTPPMRLDLRMTFPRRSRRRSDLVWAPRIAGFRRGPSHCCSREENSRQVPGCCWQPGERMAREKDEAVCGPKRWFGSNRSPLLGRGFPVMSEVRVVPDATAGPGVGPRVAAQRLPLRAPYRMPTAVARAWQRKWRQRKWRRRLWGLLPHGQVPMKSRCAWRNRRCTRIVAGQQQRLSTGRRQIWSFRTECPTRWNHKPRRLPKPEPTADPANSSRGVGQGTSWLATNRRRDPARSATSGKEPLFGGGFSRAGEGEQANHAFPMEREVHRHQVAQFGTPICCLRRVRMLGHTNSIARCNSPAWR